MRIQGRRLYPSTLAERRVMMRLAGVPLYAPRKVSPYLLARRVERAARAEQADVSFVREVLERRKPRRAPSPTTQVESVETADGSRPVAA
jgi:hypothetical protein